MTLFRYIFREFIPPFIFSLSLIVFLFTLNLVLQMLGKIAGKGLAWTTVGEFFVLNLAWMLALAVPMAVLVAVLTAYGRLSSDGEITALKATGVGQLRLLTPSLFMGTLTALMLLAFNNNILPQLNHRSRALQADIKRKKPTMVLEPGVFLSDIPGYVLYARGVNSDSSRLSDVLVYQEDDPDYSTVITARSGTLKFSEVSEAFEFALEDGQINRANRTKPNEYQNTDFNEAVFRIAAPDMSLKRTDSEWLSDREMNVEQLQARLAEYIKQDPIKNKKNINSLRVEIQKKFSIPAACIVFAVLGTILGQMVRASGMGVSAGYSLAFFLIYWVFLISGEDLADRGRIEPWHAMWAPNFLFAVLALLLIWRARYGQIQNPFRFFKQLFNRKSI